MGTSPITKLFNVLKKKTVFTCLETSSIKSTSSPWLRKFVNILSVWDVKVKSLKKNERVGENEILGRGLYISQFNAKTSLQRNLFPKVKILKL